MVKSGSECFGTVFQVNLTDKEKLSDKPIIKCVSCLKLACIVILGLIPNACGMKQLETFQILCLLLTLVTESNLVSRNVD